jgi:hypothetical protein
MAADQNIARLSHLKEFSNRIGGFIKEALHRRDSRLDLIEERLDALEIEGQKGVAVQTYRGTWADGNVYGRGVFVTCKGSLWHSERDENASRPGTSPSWRLAVKQGNLPRGSR